MVQQQHYWHPRQLSPSSGVLPDGADPCIFFGENATVDTFGCPCDADDGAEMFLIALGIGIHVIGECWWPSRSPACSLPLLRQLNARVSLPQWYSGSVGINTGQNLQAMGLAQMKEGDRQMCSRLLRSRLWAIGCVLFISCSMINFAALTLAPASILVPLEAVQFISNVAFGKFVRKVEVPTRMLLGVLAMVVGVALAVYFGESSNFCFTEEELIKYWTFTDGWGWWIFLAMTFGISAAALVAHKRLWARRAAGLPVKDAEVYLPVLYAIPSTLLGGSQMIVQSKCLAELIELMARGETLTIAGWFFWVEAALVCGFGLFWFFRLTQSLGMYEPLFIIPLMQANFIVWGGIAGGIFFHEFEHVHLGPLLGGSWFFYLFGLALVVYGLYLVRPKSSDEVANAEMAEGRAPGNNDLVLDVDLPAPVKLPPGRRARVGAEGRLGSGSDSGSGLG